MLSLELEELTSILIENYLLNLGCITLRFKKCHNVQLSPQLFFGFCEVEVSFTIVLTAQGLFGPTRSATKVVSEYVAKRIFKHAAIHDDFVEIVQLLPLWFLANWHFQLLSDLLFQTGFVQLVVRISMLRLYA